MLPMLLLITWVQKRGKLERLEGARFRSEKTAHGFLKSDYLFFLLLLLLLFVVPQQLHFDGASEDDFNVASTPAA